jgi:hypothetical protein
MARKVGQIIARGDRRWLIRVYLGRDHETKKRNYHNRTIRGSMREAQAYLTKKLRERDLGRDLEGAKITLDEYLDRWLETAVSHGYDRRPARIMTVSCDDMSGPAWATEFWSQCARWTFKPPSSEGCRLGRSGTHMRCLHCGRRCNGVCCSRILSMVSKSRSSSEAKCVHSLWSRRKLFLRLLWQLRRAQCLRWRSPPGCGPVNIWL